MRFIIFFALVLFFQAAYSASPKMDGDIAEVVTLDSWKDTEYRAGISPYYRFRAIKYNPIESETGGSLVIEKLYRGGEGAPYKTFFSEKVDLLANPAMKEELKKLHFESQIGCCHARDIKWDAFKLTYNVKVSNKYKCEIENVNKDRKPICTKEVQ